jgi:hypothetical protein
MVREQNRRVRRRSALLALLVLAPAGTAMVAGSVPAAKDPTASPLPALGELVPVADPFIDLATKLRKAELALPGPAADAPTNDNFANAIVASSTPFTDTRSTAGATTEAGEPLPCGLMGATMWYRFVTGSTATISADTTTSNYDTVIAVYHGTTLAGLTNDACNDDSGGTLQSSVSFTGGANTYYLQVGGFNGNTGTAVVHLSFSAGGCPGPANNCFANAIAIVGFPFSTGESTAGATTESGEPLPCGAMGTTVWWRFSVATSGQITADTFTSDYDTVLASYSGTSLGGLTNLACNDDTSSLQSQISFNVVPGVQYDLQLGGFGGQTGNAVLHVSFSTCGGPANNCFANAVTVSPTPHNPVTDMRSTSGATMESGEPAPCGAIGSTVWYRFTPTQNGGLIVDTLNSDFDTVVATYTGSSLSTLTNIACNDDFSGVQSQVAHRVTGGTTYYIQIGGFGGQTGNLVAHFTFGVPPGAPQNVNAVPGPLGTVGRIDVTWNPPADDGGLPIFTYHVSRNGANAANPPASPFTDTGRTPLFTYRYRVSAENLAGEGPQSSEVCQRPSPWIASLGCIGSPPLP